MPVYTEAEVLELAGMVHAMESSGAAAVGARGKITQEVFDAMYRDSFDHPAVCNGGVGKCASACPSSDGGHYKPLRPLLLRGMSLAGLSFRGYVLHTQLK